jgi:hypothetical protein
MKVGNKQNIMQITAPIKLHSIVRISKDQILIMNFCANLKFPQNTHTQSIQMHEVLAL